MAVRRYVIVGTGVAGIAACEAIRKTDSSGEIALIGDEACGYYSRPGLAYYLTGELPERQLFPYSAGDMKRLGVTQIFGQAARIDGSQHRVWLSGGQALPYDRLLVAVGAAAAGIDARGSTVQGVVKLDSLADARTIIKLARRGREAVVVGGGITALEIVEGLAARGVKVHYFLRGSRYWGNVLDETESHIIEQRLRDEGVLVHYHTELEEVLSRHGRVSGVRTRDGRQIECSIVGFAIGIRPRIELAQRSGLQTRRGILVDTSLQSSQADIFAAGDVAEVQAPGEDGTVINSLWVPAREQGAIAGANMSGATICYERPPLFNITRLANLTTTIIGAVGGGEDPDLAGIARGDSETWRRLPDAIAAQDNFEVNRLRLMVGARKLLGAILIGDQTLSQPLQRIIRDGLDISPIREQLLRPGAQVADILAQFWCSIKSPIVYADQKS